MQVRIEIDVKPEELRRFLGLPDVGGLQDDFIDYLREKVGSAGEFDAPAFLRGNIDTLRKSPALRRLLAAARMHVDEDEDQGEASSSRSTARKSATGKRTSRGAAAAKKGGRGKSSDDD